MAVLCTLFIYIYCHSKPRQEGSRELNLFIASFVLFKVEHVGYVLKLI